MQHYIRAYWPIALAVAFAGFCLATTRADVVTDWNQIMFQAALAAKTSPLDMSRNAAIVQGAVYDAVNGIERSYTPFHVKPAVSRRASPQAAAMQAAYASLVKLYPTQQSSFDAQRAASLAAVLGKGYRHRRQEAVEAGIQWGQQVADAIWAWRSTDGFTPAPPPFLGGTNVGEWRPTPPAFAPGLGPQYASMTPWVIQSPWQFRPGGPPALTSARYAAVFNETKFMGSLLSSTRTADQTLASSFWNSSTASFYWNSLPSFLVQSGTPHWRRTRSCWRR
jgi:hypothetical protein